MLNEVLKIGEKCYLMMEKLIKTTRNKDLGSCILKFFIRSTELERQCKNRTYFSFDFGWYSSILSILILSVKNRGGMAGREGGVLNGQNPLSMMKVIS